MFFKTELFTKQQNFGFVQIQSICRRQNKCDSKTEICFGTGRKHCWKRRKCCLPAFSPFPTMFSKGYFPKVVKRWDCVYKVQVVNNEFNSLRYKKQPKCRYFKVVSTMRCNRVEDSVDQRSDCRFCTV